jgi:hypothetical protein
LRIDGAAARCCSRTTQTDASDHLLIALCQRADFLGKAIDGINSAEPDEDRADDQTAPLYEELGTIQTAIVNMRDSDLCRHRRQGALRRRNGLCPRPAPCEGAARGEGQVGEGSARGALEMIAASPAIVPGMRKFLAALALVAG